MSGPLRADGSPRPVAHHDLTLLVVDDPALLDEIRALVPLDDYVLAVVDDTRLVIDPARTGELASRLAARGLTPLVKSARRAAGDALARQISWNHDDATQPRLPRQRAGDPES